MVKVAILGVSGYTGLELVKLVLNHPKMELNYLATSSGGEKLSELHSNLASIFEADIQKVDIKKIAENDLVFLALPHKTAMEFIKELMKFPHLKIVDLSADYRLTQKVYEENYLEHIDSENLKNSVYGLPELYREEIKKTRLVANPGCYPTGAILGIVPFLKFKKEGSPIFIDAKSGVSGAGKKCTSSTHYVSINENMFAYNPLKHRHSAEIKEKIGFFGNQDYQVNFVPHLVPVSKGMLVSIYMEVKKQFDAIQVLKDFYKNEQFIRIREKPVSMLDTVKTNFCDIFAQQDNNIIYIETSLDNLMRGASSQAVVNANLMLGFEENLGIPLF